jgi:hemerythrin-like domain-containing protein
MAAELRDFFSTTFRQHHADEELHVFPSLLTSSDPAIEHAVQSLKQDHGWLEEDWREIEPQLDAIAAGQTWYDIDTLHEAVSVFTALLRDHVALEESVIYPQVRRRLDTVQRKAMGREMAARRRAAARP